MSKSVQEIHLNFEKFPFKTIMRINTVILNMNDMPAYQ